MRHTTALPLLAAVLVLAGAIGGPATARADAASSPPAGVGPRCSNEALCRTTGLAPRTGTQPRTRSGRADRASGPAGSSPCADGSGASCGTVTAPLDYRRPGGTQLRIAYKLYRHTTAGPAVSTTVFLEGGPGQSSTRFGDQDARDVLGDSFGAHDVLLVDLRGRGSSGAIDCAPLQQATGPQLDTVRSCGRQLGATVPDWSAAYAARDLERVRAALSIPKLDLVGLSYGTMESVAYATRFPSRVRAIVMASGASPTFADFRSEVTTSAVSGRRVQTDLCRTSTHCDEIGRPLQELALAAAALRKHPLSGRAPDPLGVERSVTVTQNTLVRAARADSATLAAWVLPAVVAYRRGDPAPLLRLGAAKDWEARPSDSGDPSDFSAGLRTAEYCGDKTHLPWRPGSTEAQRTAAAVEAVGRMPASLFFPWAGTAMAADPVTSTVGALDLCLSWPDATGREPVLPAHPVYPDVPVLAVVGDYDSFVDETVTIADAKRFPRHQVVTMRGGDHLAAFFACPDSTRVFLDTLGKAPACTVSWRWYLQPSFPKHVAQVPITGLVPQQGDATTPRDRRVVAAAWRTVLDGWIQAWDRPDFTTSRGLRGGTLRDSDDGKSQYDIDLAGYRFTQDLGLTGRLVTPFDGRPSSGTFDLSGRGGTGRLTITAAMSLQRDGAVTISGTVNGHRVAVTTSSF